MPYPLPPRLDLVATLVRALSVADQALGRLAGIGSSLPNPRLLIAPFLRREAVLSSRIEGTQASLSDLVLFEAAPDVPPPVADVRQVANYVRALDYGLSPARNLPISLRLIRELHRILMDGVRGEAQTPGEFRTVQNFIGPPGATEAMATFVPPPVPEMLQALDAFEHYLQAPSDLPPLVRLALIHYQFEAIHPFLDGNGRVGRLLISLLLCEDKLLEQPLLYLSAFFDRQRAAYYARLLAVSQRSDFEGWVRFFLEGVTTQARDAVRRADRLHALRDDYRGRLKAAKAASLPYRLVDALFEQPAVSASIVARRLGVTHRAAMQSLEKLKRMGLVQEPLARKRNRVFLAQEVYRVLEEDLI